MLPPAAILKYTILTSGENVLTLTESYHIVTSVFLRIKKADRSETERARELFERLLERTQHVKVWITYAQHEARTTTDLEVARRVFRRGYEQLRKQGLKEER